MFRSNSLPVMIIPLGSTASRGWTFMFRIDFQAGDEATRS